MSAPSSDKQYIVWEYPIREMYIHINSVIEKSGYVKDYEEGLSKVRKIYKLRNRIHFDKYTYFCRPLGIVTTPLSTMQPKRNMKFTETAT